MEAWVEARGFEDIRPDGEEDCKWLGRTRRATRRREERTRLEPVRSLTCIRPARH